jgi:hypothetical protein
MCLASLVVVQSALGEEHTAAVEGGCVVVFFLELFGRDKLG